MSPPIRIHPATKHCSRRLRSNMTDAEKLLWRNLRKEQIGDYKFRRQHPLGQFILDFVCLEARLIIEVDGGHHMEQQEKDEERTLYLEQQGFRVLRFWNNDVLSNIESVKQAIWQALSPNQPPSQPLSHCALLLRAKVQGSHPWLPVRQFHCLTPKRGKGIYRFSCFDGISYLCQGSLTRNGWSFTFTNLITPAQCFGSP